MTAAGVSLILKRLLASVLFANFLFLSTLLRDRGKQFLDSEGTSTPVLRASFIKNDINNPLELVDDEWRFKFEKMRGKKWVSTRNLLTQNLTQNELLSCDDLSHLFSTATYINSGWTKVVFRAAASPGRREVALKTVNLQGRQLADCLLNQRKLDECYSEAAAKLIKEILLLNRLKHQNIIQLLGYCIPKNPLDVPSTDSVQRLVVITELGQPLDLIRLLQMDWEQRLGIFYDVAQLLDFLASNPSGSIGIKDFRRQQFVTVGETLKIVDVDDFQLEEPSCSRDEDCRIHKTGFNHSVKCTSQICSGYNELQNLQKAAALFFKDNLRYGAPTYLSSRISELLHRISEANLTTLDLRNFMEQFAVQLSYTSVYTGRAGEKSQLSGFKSRAQSDLAGLGDYPCVGSRSMVGCALSVSSISEAQEICLSQSACKAFVWTSRKTWTGRSIVHFKNNVSSPTYNSMTFLYIRDEY